MATATRSSGRPKRTRPPRAEVDPAAVDLLQRHGAQLMAVARRYAATPEDAEDAYQRGVEILLTKAPTTDPGELLPWLKTVVKHEAFALRKQGERHGVPSEPEELEPLVGRSPGPADLAERRDTLRLGAEALSHLKPQEVRALLLRADGLSYREICDATGWTYTKVNRCLSEGRRSFVERVAGIETGGECERIAPLLSALVDGEIGAEKLARLRPHLRSCLACRARLREYRAAPSRVAALAPLGLLGSLWAALRGSARAAADGFASRADAATHWFQSRAALAAARWQDAGEIVAAHKAAAVTASALALAGGSAATVATLPHRAGRRTAEHGAQHGNPAVRLHEATSASPHGAGAPAAQNRFVSQTGPAPRTRSPAPPPRTAPANTASPRSSAGASPSGAAASSSPGASFAPAPASAPQPSAAPPPSSSGGGEFAP